MNSSELNSRRERVERRHLGAARHAPAGPEVDQQVLAGEILDGYRRPGVVLNSQVGIATALAGAVQRRELPDRHRVDRRPRPRPAPGIRWPDAGHVAKIRALRLVATRRAGEPRRQPVAGRGLSLLGQRYRAVDQVSNGVAMSNRMWGGRFSSGPDAIMEEINASIGFDHRLYRQDIAGSIAHATMLAETGILTEADRDAIVKGLKAVLEGEIDGRQVHVFARARRHPHECRKPAEGADRRTPPGGCTRPARATTRWRPISASMCATPSIRCWPRSRRCSSALVKRAEEEADTIMPGFTHLQSAQPVTFGHHLLAYVEMLGRDCGRLR